MPPKLKSRTLEDAISANVEVHLRKNYKVPNKYMWSVAAIIPFNKAAYEESNGVNFLKASLSE